MKYKDIFETFRPKGPEGKFEWLSTTHINKVMEQYEKEIKIDTDFHDYLSNSLNSPRRDCLVNYMAHNRHNPDVLYVGKHHQDNLMYMYADLDYIPINLSNRTVTTT